MSVGTSLSLAIGYLVCGSELWPTFGSLKHLLKTKRRDVLGTERRLSVTSSHQLHNVLAVIYAMYMYVHIH